MSNAKVFLIVDLKLHFLLNILYFSTKFRPIRKIALYQNLIFVLLSLKLSMLKTSYDTKWCHTRIHTKDQVRKKRKT